MVVWQCMTTGFYSHCFQNIPFPLEEFLVWEKLLPPSVQVLPIPTCVVMVGSTCPSPSGLSGRDRGVAWHFQ